jgi:hypothetical protein
MPLGYNDKHLSPSQFTAYLLLAHAFAVGITTLVSWSAHLGPDSAILHRRKAGGRSAAIQISNSSRSWVAVQYRIRL